MLYLKEKACEWLFHGKRFRDGKLVMQEIWPKHQRDQKFKMLGWYLLMLIFTRRQVDYLRAFLVRFTPIRWGDGMTIQRGNLQKNY